MKAIIKFLNIFWPLVDIYTAVHEVEKEMWQGSSIRRHMQSIKTTFGPDHVTTEYEWEEQ